jgi:hypothetical protein
LAPAGLAWVDSEVAPSEAYTPDANLEDDYHCFVLDPGLGATKELIGFETRPGVQAEVHHVLVFAAKRTEALALDQANPGVGWRCFAGSGISGASLVGAWVPGTPPLAYPEGTGIPIEVDQVLVMQIHYNTTSVTPAPDRTTVRLQLAREPVAKRAAIVPLADAGFAIPPWQVGTAGASLTVPAEVQVWGVAPHMHTMGKDIRVEAGGECLIDIPRWDFHWQQLYFYSQPKTLPRGTQASLSCTFANSSEHTLRWGEGTSDEMCLNYFYVTLGR